MESLIDVLTFIKNNMGMVRLDIRTAFFTLSVNTARQQYFKSEELKKYKFIGMPNGFLDFMRIFTKTS